MEGWIIAVGIIGFFILIGIWAKITAIRNKRINNNTTSYSINSSARDNTLSKEGSYGQPKRTNNNNDGNYNRERYDSNGRRIV